MLIEYYYKHKICLVMTRQIAKWEWKKMTKKYYYKYKICLVMT